MRRPGDRVRAFAARWCDGVTMTRLVDPAIADLQAEHDEAVRAGRAWYGRWMMLVSHAALAKLLAVCAWRRTWSGGPQAERSAGARAAGISVAALGLATVMLHGPSLLFGGSLRWLLLFMIPESLPFTIPMASLVGSLYGLRNTVVSGRLVGSVLAIGLVASAASLTTLEWIGPLSERAFSVIVSERIGADPPARPPQEFNELTLGELRRQIQSEGTAMSASPRHRQLEWVYYSRITLSCAPLVLALLSLALIVRRSLGRVTAGVTAVVICVGYCVLLFQSSSQWSHGSPAMLAAWVPNFVTLLVAASLAYIDRPRCDDNGVRC
jgi:hypothetical protein